MSKRKLKSGDYIISDDLSETLYVEYILGNMIKFKREYDSLNMFYERTDYILLSELKGLFGNYVVLR